MKGLKDVMKRVGIVLLILGMAMCQTEIESFADVTTGGGGVSPSFRHTINITGSGTVWFNGNSVTSGDSFDLSSGTSYTITMRPADGYVVHRIEEVVAVGPRENVFDLTDDLSWSPATGKYTCSFTGGLGVTINITFAPQGTARSYSVSGQFRNASSSMTFSVDGVTVTSAEAGQRVDIVLPEPQAGLYWVCVPYLSLGGFSVVQVDINHFYFIMPANAARVEATLVDGTTEPISHSFIYDKSTHGHIDGALMVLSGSNVYFSPIPDRGYKYAAGTIKAKKHLTGEDIELVEGGINRWFILNLNCDIDVSAEFKPITYLVRFQGNGSTSGSMADQRFKYDEAQTLSANGFGRALTVSFNYNGATGGVNVASEVANATFNGWATSAGGEVEYTDGQSVSNLKYADGAIAYLYAKWTDDTVTLPEPTKSGYYLEGWYSDAGCSEGNKVGEGGGSYTPTQSCTLYAKWIEKTPISPEVRITGWTYGSYNSTANTPSLTAASNPGGGVVTYEYFTDSTCTTKTNTANSGADSEGAVPKNAGTYYVKATVAETAKHARGSATASFTISPISVTITGLSAENKIFDGTTDATANGTAVITGVLDADKDNLIVVPGSASFSDKNVGTGKTVTFTGYSLTGTAAGNYTLSAQPANTTADITPKSITGATVTLNNTQLEYNASEQSVSVTSVKVGDLTLTADVDYDVISGTTGTDANTYTVTVTGKGNCKDSATATWEITPKTVTNPTITLSQSSYTYDRNEKKPGVTSVKDGTAEIPSGEYAIGYSNNTDAGTATVTITDNSGGNYDISGSTTFTISPKPVTVTGITATSRDYDPDNLSVSLSGGTVSDVEDGDTVTVDLSDATGTMTDENAGTNKAVTVTGVRLGSDDADNYTLSAQPTGVTVTINKIAWTKKEVSGSQKYGETKTMDISDLIAPGGTIGAVTKSDEDQVLSGDPSVTDGELSFIFTDDAGKVGKQATVTIPITNATNYSDYYITVTMIVKELPTLTLEDIVKTYDGLIVGDSSISGTATVGGTPVEGTLKFKESEASRKNVADSGEYCVVFTPTDSANYMEVEETLRLTINRKEVTVKADNKTKTVGAAEPLLTATISGLVGTDSVAYSISRKEGETVGNYTITATGAAVQVNYDVTYQNGTFTIETPTGGGSDNSPGGGGNNPTPGGGSGSGGSGGSGGADPNASVPSQSSAPVSIPGTSEPVTTINPDGSTTTTTTNVESDGSTTTTAVTIDADGNKTTETTKIKADGSTEKVVETVKTDGTTEKATEIKKADGSTEKTTEVIKPDGASEKISDIVTADGTTIHAEIRTTAKGVETSKTVETAPSGNMTVTEQVTQPSGDYSKVTLNTIVNKDESGNIISASVTINTEKKSGKVIVKSSFVVLNVGSTTKERALKAILKEASSARNAVALTKATSTKKNGTITIEKTVKADGKTYTVTTLKKGLLEGNKTKPKQLLINASGITNIEKGAFNNLSKKATIKVKANKKDYKRIKKLITKSGVGKGVKIKRVK